MTNSAASLKNEIGKTGLWDTGGVRVQVVVVDARVSWGRVHFQVTPKAGTGRVWVDKEKVTQLQFFQ